LAGRERATHSTSTPKCVYIQLFSIAVKQLVLMEGQNHELWYDIFFAIGAVYDDVTLRYDIGRRHCRKIER
jgi:hypothetical protein